MVVRKRVAIVFNSHSGKRRTKKAMKKAKRFFELEAELASIIDLHDQSIAEMKKSPVDVVCAIGGDGTLQQVLQYLQDSSLHIPILLIPRGSANVVAKSLRIPKEVSKNLTKFTNNTKVAVDVARVNKRKYFISAFALGYFSERITKTASKHKQRFGMWGYILSFLNDRNLSFHSFKLTVDGKEQYLDGHSCFIVNTADLFGFSTRRRMSYRDGIFELVVASNKKFVSLMHVVLDFYFRRSQPKHFTLFKGKHFKIETSDKLDVQIDGDRIPYEKKFSIEVLPKSQSFYI